LHLLAESQLFKCHLANIKRKCHLVKMPEPVTLLSMLGMGAKLGEGMFDQLTFDQMTYYRTLMSQVI
jgi:hypothetical protein